MEQIEELIVWNKGNMLYKDIQLEELETAVTANLNLIKKSFVIIGFLLRIADEKKMYEEAGYKNIWDYASEKFGISRTTAWWYMAINSRYSEGGYSPELDTRYKDFDKCQLQEMYKLSDDILEKVTPDMTVNQIRNMKKAETARPELAKEQKEQEELRKPTEEELVIEFYKHLYTSEKEIIQKRNAADITKMFKKEHGSTYEGVRDIGFGWNCYPDKICFTIHGIGQVLQITWGKFTTKLLRVLDDHPELKKEPERQNITDYPEAMPDDEDGGDEDCATSHNSESVEATEAEYDERWFTLQLYRNCPDDVERAVKICQEMKGRDNNDIAKAVKKKLAPCNYSGRHTRDFDVTFLSFSKGIYCEFERKKKHMTYTRFVKELQALVADDEENCATSHNPESEEPIDKLDLSVNTYCILKKSGIDTIDELQGMSDEELTKLRGMSMRSLTEIRTKLKAYGSELCDVAQNKPDAPESVADLVVDGEYVELSDVSSVPAWSGLLSDMPVFTLTDVKDYLYKQEQELREYQRVEEADGLKLPEKLMLKKKMTVAGARLLLRFVEEMEENKWRD